MKLISAGPVISTRPSSRQSMWSDPPSSTTSVRRPVRPRRAVATPTAQAPVPQARVMPTPRSHTRMRTRVAERICTNSTFVRAGNSGSVSIRGPRPATSTASASGTTKITCGLPIDTATGSDTGPSA